MEFKIPCYYYFGFYGEGIVYIYRYLFYIFLKKRIIGAKREEMQDVW